MRLKTEREELAELADRTPTSEDSWSVFSNQRAVLIGRFGSWKETLTCQDCGTSFKGQPGSCHFHHIDPEHKIDNVSTMINDGAHIADIMAEMDKCLILCRSCHRKEHHQMGTYND